MVMCQRGPCFLGLFFFRWTHCEAKAGRVRQSANQHMEVALPLPLHLWGVPPVLNQIGTPVYIWEDFIRTWDH